MEEESIIIDIGSGTFKCGLSGGLKPSFLYDISNEDGKHRNIFKILNKHDHICFVGDTAHQRKTISTGDKCMSYGRITDFQMVVESWKKILNEEKIFSGRIKKDYHEYPVVLTESPTTPISDRLKTMEVFFEEFGVNELYIGLQPIFALHTLKPPVGTGIVVDIGKEVTHITPMKDYQACYSGIITCHFGGEFITEILKKLLVERGYVFEDENTPCNDDYYLTHSTAVDLKEKLCYALEGEYYEGHLSRIHQGHYGCEREYELKDGSKMTIGHYERIGCLENLFKKFVVFEDQLLTKSTLSKIFETKSYGYGLDSLILQSLSLSCSTAPNLGNTFVNNIILSGGSTSFLEFGGRLSFELKKNMEEAEDENIKRIRDSVKVWGNTYFQENRNWVGAKRFAQNLSKEGYVGKDEYADSGGNVMNLKKFRHYYNDFRRESESRIDTFDRILFLVENLSRFGTSVEIVGDGWRMDVPKCFLSV